MSGLSGMHALVVDRNNHEMPHHQQLLLARMDLYVEESLKESPIQSSNPVSWIDRYGDNAFGKMMAHIFGWLVTIGYPSNLHSSDNSSNTAASERVTVGYKTVIDVYFLPIANIVKSKHQSFRHYPTSAKELRSCSTPFKKTYDRILGVVGDKSLEAWNFPPMMPPDVTRLVSSVDPNAHGVRLAALIYLASETGVAMETWVQPMLDKCCIERDGLWTITYRWPQNLSDGRRERKHTLSPEGSSWFGLFWKWTRRLGDWSNNKTLFGYSTTAEIYRDIVLLSQLAGYPKGFHFSLNSFSHGHFLSKACTFMLQGETINDALTMARSLGGSGPDDEHAMFYSDKMLNGIVEIANGRLDLKDFQPQELHSRLQHLPSLPGPFRKEKLGCKASDETSIIRAELAMALRRGGQTVSGNPSARALSTRLSTLVRSTNKSTSFQTAAANVLSKFSDKKVGKAKTIAEREAYGKVVLCMASIGLLRPDNWSVVEVPEWVSSYFLRELFVQEDYEANKLKRPTYMVPNCKRPDMLRAIKGKRRKVRNDAIALDEKNQAHYM